jgi:peptidoglycan/LPS O-acetylase OafA/YrhL
MTQAYLPFLDWMKAVGLGLIVFGHVAHGMVAWATPPFYPKQLGVAFFVFVTGYTLARERRPVLQAVIRRWFDIWAYGLLFALLMTAVGLIWFRDGNPSDYLPLAGGFNVLFDNFPANPTTWYIGTYLHLLLVWALILRRFQVTGTGLVLAAGLEIAARAVLVPFAGPFIAYQSVFNWLTVLLLGLAFGQQQMAPSSKGILRGVAMFVGWPIVMWRLGWTSTFPFMTSTLFAAPWNAWLLSVNATMAYVGYTVAAFNVLGRLPESRVVRFVARNTLLVFIAHMPLYRALETMLQTVMPYSARALTEFVICFFGLALISEVIRRALEPTLHRLRDRVARICDL